jgi:hypothetical protein
MPRKQPQSTSNSTTTTSSFISNSQYPQMSQAISDDNDLPMTSPSLRSSFEPVRRQSDGDGLFRQDKHAKLFRKLSRKMKASRKKKAKKSKNAKSPRSRRGGRLRRMY